MSYAYLIFNITLVWCGRLLRAGIASFSRMMEWSTSMTSTITQQQRLNIVIGDLFHLSTDEAYLANANGANGTFDEYTLWHHRLGHPGRKVMRSMTQHVTGLGDVRLTDQINDICLRCACAKSHRQP